ncbi:HSP20-like chaperones superfamily protein [Abeliophyllum distichum]|uniref:HSP20-like chaperones superfamily protein n=1 Tax=Abeliophyllum distichum TaxID=126358 RepID=A0ABD1RDL1_9LAMI
MGEDLLTGLSIENYHPSTFLSMDSIVTSHEESNREMNRQVVLPGPPDINLPLSVERSPPPQQLWNHDSFDMLEVGLGHQVNESDKLFDLPKIAQKMCQEIG